ncbi:MAG: hypothetical protein R2712_25570 [Vicinamibacterales bacterium]
MAGLYLAWRPSPRSSSSRPAPPAVVVHALQPGGRRAGMAASGAAVANSFHATLAGLGLWVLLGRWPAVLDAVRGFCGAASRAWARRSAACGQQEAKPGEVRNSE